MDEALRLDLEIPDIVSDGDEVLYEVKLSETFWKSRNSSPFRSFEDALDVFGIQEEWEPFISNVFTELNC